MTGIDIICMYIASQKHLHSTPTVPYHTIASHAEVVLYFLDCNNTLASLTWVVGTYKILYYNVRIAVRNIYFSNTLVRRKILIPIEKSYALSEMARKKCCLLQGVGLGKKPPFS
jgi:hypothetical protein